MREGTRTTRLWTCLVWAAFVLAGCGYVSLDTTDAADLGPADADPDPVDRSVAEGAPIEDGAMDARDEDAADLSDADAADAADASDVADTMDAADAVDMAEPDMGDPLGAGLVHRGLLARYFLEETGLSEPRIPVGTLDMPLFPLDTANVSVVDLPTGRGLAFGVAGADDGFCTTDASPLPGALNGGFTGTIEVVVRVDDATENQSRLLGTDYRMNWNFSLAVRGVSDPANTPAVRFSMNDVNYAMGTWEVPYGERHVFTLTVDSQVPEVRRRTTLFVDGVRRTDNGAAFGEVGETVPLGSTINNNPNSGTCIGNRYSDRASDRGDRAFQGTIGYAAYYDIALTDAEAAQNAARLLANDDR
ncbi:MAG: hypothetical protein AAF411_19815 [Myxococcota bacterium]